MQQELRNCLERRTSLLVGGYSRESYIDEVVRYINERYREKKYKEKPVHTQEIKKTRLSSFENHTETTSINRCTVCIVAPNTGLIAEIVGRVMHNKSVLENEVKKNVYNMLGETNDDFILPLTYSDKNGFEETSNMQADIVITTMKALVTMGDHKIDRKKYFINEKEELEGFKQKIKHDMNIYAFLSGVDTIILIDADILEIQNAVSLRETLKIMEDAKPSPKQQLNLRYISSGKEKKAFIFLANIITPMLSKTVEMYSDCKIVSKLAVDHALQDCSINIRLDRSTDINTYVEHHVANLSELYGRVLLVVKDSIELKSIEEGIKNNSPISIQSIFFMDEYTPKTKIKEALESKKKRAWVVTERFIFYRRKRLSRIITPYDPVKVFSPHVINPRLLGILNQAVCLQETDDNEYRSPIIMRAQSPADEYFLSEFFERKVTIDEIFAYADDITIKREDAE